MLKRIILLYFSLSSLLFAEHLSLQEHEKGWYWHNDPEKIKQQHSLPKAQPTQPTNPDKTWKLIGKMVEQSRAKAILNPTVQNITHARQMQRLIVAQANLFSEHWMLNLLLHPELDEHLVNPNNSGGRGVYNEQNNLIKEQLISTISQGSGLYYFYKGGEPFSERMAEVVRDFAVRYQMQLVPIAMSAQFPPLLPNSQIDSGQANQMRVKHIPAVFVRNPYSKEMMPVAYGLMSQSDLKDNLFLATQAFKAGGYNER
jgi:conjugal transfer pilus assembly protein TraF